MDKTHGSMAYGLWTKPMILWPMVCGQNLWFSGLWSMETKTYGPMVNGLWTNPHGSMAFGLWTKPHGSMAYGLWTKNYGPMVNGLWTKTPWFYGLWSMDENP